MSVAIHTSNYGAEESATFKIYDSGTNGMLRNEVYELTTPTLVSGSTALFAAPTGATLDPDTNYHVVFQSSGDTLDDLR